jgi:hypothetical protein
MRSGSSWANAWRECAKGFASCANNAPRIASAKPSAALGKQNSDLRATEIETQSRASRTAVAENVSADQTRSANLTAIAAQIVIAIRKRASVVSAHLVRRTCVAA